MLFWTRVEKFYSSVATRHCQGADCTRKDRHKADREYLSLSHILHQQALPAALPSCRSTCKACKLVTPVAQGSDFWSSPSPPLPFSHQLLHQLPSPCLHPLRTARWCWWTVSRTQASSLPVLHPTCLSSWLSVPRCNKVTAWMVIWWHVPLSSTMLQAGNPGRSPSQMQKPNNIHPGFATLTFSLKKHPGKSNT